MQQHLPPMNEMPWCQLQWPIMLMLVLIIYKRTNLVDSGTNQIILRILPQVSISFVPRNAFVAQQYVPLGHHTLETLKVVLLSQSRLFWLFLRWWFLVPNSLYKIDYYSQYGS
jgi:hypothetical protein